MIDFVGERGDIKHETLDFDRSIWMGAGVIYQDEEHESRFAG